MPTTTKETALVTTDELIELADWERKHSEAKRKVSAAEKELKHRRGSLAEKVLGVKCADDLKKLSPREIAKLYTKRLEAGDWKPERGAPEFSFVKTSEGTYPAWKQIYIAEFGETKADEISADTPITFSYAVEVTLP